MGTVCKKLVIDVFSGGGGASLVDYICQLLKGFNRLDLIDCSVLMRVLWLDSAELESRL